MYPKIKIDRFLPHILSWQVFSDQHVTEEDFRDHTIDECLKKVMHQVPTNTSLIDIVYCGYHMGTIKASDVRVLDAQCGRSNPLMHGAFSRIC